MSPARHRLFHTLVVSGAMLGGCDAFETPIAPRSSFDGGATPLRDAGRAGQGGGGAGGFAAVGGIGGLGGIGGGAGGMDADAGDTDAGSLPCDPIACNCGYYLPQCAGCETIWCAIT